MATSVWVVHRDYGAYDGIRPASAAFLTKEEADGYARHLSADHYEHVVHEVPVMRFVPAVVQSADLPPISDHILSTEG